MPGAGRWVQEGRVAAAAVLKVEPAAEQAWQLEGRGVSREAGPRQLRRWQSMARAAHAEHKNQEYHHEEAGSGTTGAETCGMISREKVIRNGLHQAKSDIGNCMHPRQASRQIILCLLSFICKSTHVCSQIKLLKDACIAVYPLFGTSCKTACNTCSDCAWPETFVH